MWSSFSLSYLYLTLSFLLKVLYFFVDSKFLRNFNFYCSFAVYYDLNVLLNGYFPKITRKKKRNEIKKNMDYSTAEKIEKKSRIRREFERAWVRWMIYNHRWFYYYYFCGAVAESECVYVRESEIDRSIFEHLFAAWNQPFFTSDFTLRSSYRQW